MDPSSTSILHVCEQRRLWRVRGCTSSPEPSLVAYVISTITSWAGSFVLHERFGITKDFNISVRFRNETMTSDIAIVLTLTLIWQQFKWKKRLKPWRFVARWYSVIKKSKFIHKICFQHRTEGYAFWQSIRPRSTSFVKFSFRIWWSF